MRLVRVQLTWCHRNEETRPCHHILFPPKSSHQCQNRWIWTHRHVKVKVYPRIWANVDHSTSGTCNQRWRGEAGFNIFYLLVQLPKGELVGSNSSVCGDTAEGEVEKIVWKSARTRRVTTYHENTPNIILSDVLASEHPSGRSHGQIFQLPSGVRLCFYSEVYLCVYQMPHCRIPRFILWI